MADLTRAEFVGRLLDLGHSCGDVPIYGSDEWEQLDAVDPRRFASVVRAAECWRSEGEPDAVRARLKQELAESDRLVIARLGSAHDDVHGDTDWSLAYSQMLARAAGYQEVA